MYATTKLDPVRKVLRIFPGFTRLGTQSVLSILQTVASLSLKNRLEMSTGTGTGTGIYFSFEIHEFPILKSDPNSANRKTPFMILEDRFLVVQMRGLP
jgi:hypothetical protein